MGSEKSGVGGEGPLLRPIMYVMYVFNKQTKLIRHQTYNKMTSFPSSILKDGAQPLGDLNFHRACRSENKQRF